jgi:hypothetical protein
MSGDFETVYTVTDWYDGPREGIADFNGMPHLYQWQFDNAKDDWADTLLLTPVDEETFRLALEDWAIWVRWEQAFLKVGLNKKHIQLCLKIRPDTESCENY